MKRPWLLPLVPLYAAGLALRNRRLTNGVEPIRRLAAAVVSIGNLSAGGSGKTPLAIALAQALTRRGFQVDLLSRGYGRRSQEVVRVNPEGEASLFGDEPLMMARQTGLPVYVARQRYQAGLLAERQKPPTARRIHLLDDGFQHRQLARDLDIVLVCSGDLADHLLPAGNLREALSALDRAQIVAIPHNDEMAEMRLDRIGFKGAIWHLRRRTIVLRPDGPVLAFCGIARPEQFFIGLHADGLELSGQIAFADHHRFSVRELARLVARARQAGATALMTTEKDRARIGSLWQSLDDPLPLLTAVLRTEIEDEQTALDSLLARLGLPQVVAVGTPVEIRP
jgi:tetraacyldisaccharide 4'-kinase